MLPRPVSGSPSSASRTFCRSDLRPVEEAKAYRQLMSLNGWNAAQLSRELAVSESKVTRAMALLELPEPVQNPGRVGNPAPGNGLRDFEGRRPRVSRPSSPPRSSARSSLARIPPGSSASGSKLERGSEKAARRSPERVEFTTPHGQVTVLAAQDSVVAALEEALAQARHSSLKGRGSIDEGRGHHARSQRRGPEAYVLPAPFVILAASSTSRRDRQLSKQRYTGQESRARPRAAPCGDYRLQRYECRVLLRFVPPVGRI